MERTNIYLTEEQQRRLDARSKEAGVTKSEVVRQLLDDGLGIADRQTNLEQVIAATAGIWEDRDQTQLDDLMMWRRELPLGRLEE